MSFLIKEYNIPFLGRVQLIEAAGYDKSLRGEFYAENNTLGHFCKNCNSLEELKEKVNEDIKEYFKMQEIIIKGNIESEKEKLGRLESHLSELENENWINQYQTDNELQLEKQKEDN